MGRATRIVGRAARIVVTLFVNLYFASVMMRFGGFQSVAGLIPR